MIVCIAANPAIDRLLEVKSVHVGQIHRPYRVTAVPGGKGLNAARAAAALGGRVKAVTLVGGHAGRWIDEQLLAQGVPASCAWHSYETRTCVSVVGDEDTGLTEFYEPGTPVTVEEWNTFEKLASAEVAAASVVTFSGSLPPGAAVDGMARLARRAHAGGARVICDSYGEPLRITLAQTVVTVKVNAQEATEMTDVPVISPQTEVEAAHALRRQGAEAAVVTIGADGAVVVERSGVYFCGVGPFGRYSVGSGDAFLAGLAVALDRDEPLHEAVRLGAGAAAASAAIPGPGRLERDLAERYRGQIVCARMDDG